MRFWLHTSVKSGFVLGTPISVAVHAVLIGAAVYSTGVRSQELRDASEPDVRTVFLAPPDRRAGSHASREHLAYVDAGLLSPGSGTARADTRKPTPTGSGQAPQSGGHGGSDVKMQEATIPLESRDSVFSVLDVEETATRTAESAAPVYPAELLKDGTEGGVFVRFVVDTNGHADLASIEIVRASHPLLAKSVRDAVPLMSFTPATARGRRVRQAVEQNFDFRVAPPPAPVPPARPVP